MQKNFLLVKECFVFHLTTRKKEKLGGINFLEFASHVINFLEYSDSLFSITVNLKTFETKENHYELKFFLKIHTFGNFSILKYLFLYKIKKKILFSSERRVELLFKHLKTKKNKISELLEKMKFDNFKLQNIIRYRFVVFKSILKMLNMKIMKKMAFILSLLFFTACSSTLATKPVYLPYNDQLYKTIQERKENMKTKEDIIDQLEDYDDLTEQSRSVIKKNNRMTF